jgi:Ser/Thr protein kinase RdoA (MazF antagonist)
MHRCYISSVNDITIYGVAGPTTITITMSSINIDINNLKLLIEKKLNILNADISLLTENDGTFNEIYVIKSASLQHGRAILRIARDTYPKWKTENEVATLKVVRETTNLPVPEVLFWGTDLLGNDGRTYEYICLGFLLGETLSRIWRTLSEANIEGLIEQIVQIHLALRELKSAYPHGLRIADGDRIVDGPQLTYEVYDNQHIAKYWNGYLQENFSTLNIVNIHKSQLELIKAKLKRNLHVLQVHTACEELRQSHEPLLKDVLEIIDGDQFKIIYQEPAIFHLAHRDLHFGNLLYDRETNKISGILDWELAGYFVADNWEPGNTLYPIDYGEEDKETYNGWRNKLFEVLKEINFQAYKEQETDNDSLLSIVRKFESLSFWIIFTTITGPSSDRRLRWIEEFEQKYSRVKDICT